MPYDKFIPKEIIWKFSDRNRDILTSKTIGENRNILINKKLDGIIGVTDDECKRGLTLTFESEEHAIQFVLKYW